MNTYLKLSILFFAITLTSCEDVVSVDVQTGPIRLVIEASLDWEKGTLGNEQSIKLSTSAPYFDASASTVVTNASVKVTNDTNATVFIFTHQGNGVYATTQFVPIINQSYTLEVIYDGEIYTAKETLRSVTDITAITQSRENGFNKDDLELNVRFTDPKAEQNYYLFKFQKQGDLLPVLENGDDEFTNGNEINWWYEKQEDKDTDKIDAFVPGDVVNIQFFGISEAYSHYIGILIEQSEGGGFFSSTPVPFRGNCINTTNPDKYALGYFRLTQVVRTSYTFQ